MTDSQMDAPERIWAWYWNGKTYSGQWHVAPTSILDANLYILATPTVLAADPAVVALVAEAEARGMERIKAIERLALSASIASCTCLTKTPDITFHAGDCRYVMLQYIIAQCEDFRDEAAAIRGETP